MANYQAVFERHEKKYLLTTAQYKAIRLFLDPHMREDTYGLYTISSVYYDTDTYEVIRESLAKPKYKEKLRLRSYGVPGPMDEVYLELKKKVNGIVYKRRLGLTLSEAERYMRAGIRPCRGGQILEEIDWVCGRRRLHPAAVISVERLALYGKQDPDFRVTFDFNMRGRSCNLSLAQGTGGTLLTDRDMCLMEVKTTAALPMWLTAFMSEHSIFPVSFSKYGTFYQEQLLQKGALRHAG